MGVDGVGVVGMLALVRWSSTFGAGVVAARCFAACPSASGQSAGVGIGILAAVSKSSSLQLGAAAPRGLWMSHILQ